MRIDLDKMKEDLKQETYELKVAGETYEFKLDLNALEKIEEKFKEPAHVVFLKLMVTNRTYNYLVDIIGAVLDIPDLEKKIRWTAKNISNLDNILLHMAYEQIEEDNIDILCEKIINSAKNYNKID